MKSPTTTAPGQPPTTRPTTTTARPDAPATATRRCARARRRTLSEGSLQQEACPARDESVMVTSA